MTWKIRIPDTYTLCFLTIVFVAVLTWIIPSGEYQRTSQAIGGTIKQVVVPGTYHLVPKVAVGGKDLRQGFPEVLMAPAKGIQAAAQNIAFVLIVGGTFGIIGRTGAIGAGLIWITRALKGSESIIIPVGMLVFWAAASTFGMAEETLPFFVIFIAILMAMGYDSLTGFMVVGLGAHIGYAASTLNPFSVLIAQGIAGVPGNPQLWFRFIQWVICMSVGIAFVMRYARRVKDAPETSRVFEPDQRNRAYFLAGIETAGSQPFSLRQKLVILGFSSGLGFIIWGLMARAWYMDEISMVFLGIGIFSGMVGGLPERDIASSFVQGCRDFVYASVILGIIRGVLVVAEQGKIIDTILYELASRLHGLPAIAFTTLMVLTENLFAVLVPSSSGNAAMTMPVLGPLGDLVGVNKEAIVTAYQYSSLMSMISPMSGVLMASLSIARISWSTWVKTTLKLFLVLEALAILFAAVSAYLPA